MRWLALIVVLFVAAPARAEVLEVFGATSDVYDVVTLQDGRIVAATSGGLVVIDHGGQRVLDARNGLPSARVRSVTVLEGARVLVGCVEGAAILDLDRGTVEAHIDVSRVARAVPLGAAIWIASADRGLFRWEAGALRHVRAGPRRARDRLSDLVAHDGALYVATMGAGVLRLDSTGRLRARITTEQGLPGDLVHDLAIDHGHVYVATSGGVARIAGRRVEAMPELDARLPGRDVRVVRPDRGAVILASYGAGAVRIDGERSTELAPAAKHVRAIATDRDALLIASDHGLERIAGDARTALLSGGLPSGDVTTLARAFGALYIGTFSHGLARIDGGAAHGIATVDRWGVDRRINDLAVTHDGDEERLWIATDRGLYWSDGRVFAPVEEAIGRVHVTDLHVDGDALWIAAARSLTRYRAGVFRTWTGTEELPVVSLQSVATDRDGNVWVGSLHGLYRFDPQRGTFERHGVASGDLPVDWVTAIAANDEGIVVGTYHGGIVFHDDRGSEGATGVPADVGWVNLHALHVDGARVLAGTLDRGLLVGERDTWRVITCADGLPSADVTAILANEDGTFWIGTRAGLVHMRI